MPEKTSLDSAAEEDPRSQIYQHVKTGGLYIVLEWGAIIEATMTLAVVYKSLVDGQVWVRPAEEFAIPNRFRCVPRYKARTALSEATASHTEK